MRRIYVDEQWCLGCHLCEYNCAFANSGKDSMVKALKDAHINPRIKVEEHDGITFAVNCRQCTEPLCVKACIAGALTLEDGVVCIDQTKCVSCFSCIMACPYGALMPNDDNVIQKCELCKNNKFGVPECVAGCPNKAIVFEER